MKSGAVQHYDTLSTAEICALDVQAIAERNSCAFVWATVPLLDEGLQVLSAWGYKYKTALFWNKTGRLGLGYWFRGQVEVLLFGIRGKVPAFRSSLPNIVSAPVGRHSAKPQEFRKLIEQVTPDQARIELFAREQTQGWTAWGNEIKTSINLNFKA